jgi:hypothetical protein
MGYLIIRPSSKHETTTMAAVSISNWASVIPAPKSEFTGFIEFCLEFLGIISIKILLLSRK